MDVDLLLETKPKTSLQPSQTLRSSAHHRVLIGSAAQCCMRGAVRACFQYKMSATGVRACFLKNKQYLLNASRRFDATCYLYYLEYDCTSISLSSREEAPLPGKRRPCGVPGGNCLTLQLLGGNGLTLQLLGGNVIILRHNSDLLYVPVVRLSLSVENDHACRCCVGMHRRHLPQYPPTLNRPLCRWTATVIQQRVIQQRRLPKRERSTLITAMTCLSAKWYVCFLFCKSISF